MTATHGTLFADWFERRADVASELYQREHYVDAMVIRATALDALAQIWMSDFAAEAAVAKKGVGGNASESVFFARFLREFVPGDPDAYRVAVVPFAEDMKKLVPGWAAKADALLEPRIPGYGERRMPQAYLDVPRTELANELPPVVSDPLLAQLAEEYEYAAIFYREYRCAAVHMATFSPRTHGFARDGRAMYMRLHEAHTSIGFAPELPDRWLRSAAHAYGRRCDAAGIRPATAVADAASGADRLRGAWGRFAAQLSKKLVS